MSHSGIPQTTIRAAMAHLDHLKAAGTFIVDNSGLTHAQKNGVALFMLAQAQTANMLLSGYLDVPITAHIPGNEQDDMPF